MNKIKIILEELFYALSLALILFSLLELLKPGLISAYLNLSFFFFLVLIVTIINLFISNKKRDL